MIAGLLATDEARNRIIAADMVEALGRGRFPLVLADRKDQLKTLESMVRKSGAGSKTFIRSDRRLFNLYHSNFLCVNPPVFVVTPTVGIFDASDELRVLQVVSEVFLC